LAGREKIAKISRKTHDVMTGDAIFGPVRTFRVVRPDRNTWRFSLMRSITRMIAAGALSIPLALAAAGMASADTSYDGPYSAYAQEATAAGPEGASTYFVYSEAGYGHDHHGYYDDEDCGEEYDDCEGNYHHHHDDCENHHYYEDDCDDDCDDDDDDDDDDGLLGNFLSDLV
jgi:hypothetical protein